MLCLRLAENCATSRWIFHSLLIFEKWPNNIKMQFENTCCLILTEYNNLKYTQFQPVFRFFKISIFCLSSLKFTIIYIFECFVLFYLKFSASLIYQYVGKTHCCKEMSHPPNLQSKGLRLYFGVFSTYLLTIIIQNLHIKLFLTFQYWQLNAVVCPG